MPAVKASPTARRLAESLGVDIATVTGSGPNGRVIKEDVEAAAGGAPAVVSQPALAEAAAVATPAAGASTGAGGVQRLTGVQRVVARRMSESRSTVPEFELHVVVDMERAVALREALKLTTREGRPVPSINDMVVRASALALRNHPRANGSWDDGSFRLHERVDVGVAVAAQDALLVPVIRGVDGKALSTIAAETREIARRGREGGLTPDELEGSTFTVSNLGMFGVRSFSAVINVPEAAILAVGALERRPFVDGDAIVARHQMDLVLCCDHRILYGADAAAFLAELRGNLEVPERLL